MTQALIEPETSDDDLPSGALLHMGLAEQGKIYALGGNYSLALAYYRKAMHMSVEAGDPEVFFRHYLECLIEALEHMGSYEEVLAYCEKAIAIYSERPPFDDLTRRDLAHLYQRRAVVLLKSGDKAGAREAFEEATLVVRGTGQRLPLTEALLRWVQMAMHVDARRITAEQVRHHYFSVREGTIDRSRAVKLPAALENQVSGL